VIEGDETLGTLVGIALRELGEQYSSLEVDESMVEKDLKERWEWFCEDMKKLGGCKIR